MNEELWRKKLSHAEVGAADKTLGKLLLKGKIAQLRRAHKGHKCVECGLLIEPGEEYYCVYLAGAGLGDIKFPDHFHIKCLTKES